jgi:bifunctional polynucleotide phosphatase/kinase
MTPTIHTINDATHRTKMAAFDFDWTMVNPKEGKTFPVNIDDWEWYHPSVPTKLKQFYADGYMVVIFTNQSKKWKCDQLILVAETLDIPMFIVIATDKCDYKPNPCLLSVLIGEDTIDKEASFFVGDALGRKVDFADSDKVFAENIGIKWYSPESIFTDSTTTTATMREAFTLPSNKYEGKPEIIIMMGYPASGKSTIAMDICINPDYIHIQGDVYKTSSKMIKVSKEFMAVGKSVVFDATNSSVKKRKEYIDHATKLNYSVRCIHCMTPLDISYKRNRCREDKKQVPKIAYSVYTKYYEPPIEVEGFELITL